MNDDRPPFRPVTRADMDLAMGIIRSEDSDTYVFMQPPHERPTLFFPAWYEQYLRETKGDAS